MFSTDMPCRIDKIILIRGIPPEEVSDLLDRRTLFSTRWGYKNIGQRQRLGLESRMLEMWRELASPENWSAGAVWRAFNSEPGKGVVHLWGQRPEISLGIDLSRIDMGRRASGAMVLQAVTLGLGSTRLVKKVKTATERLFWHGLAAETTEALAEWCSRRASGDMGWNRFRRISPGFPAWPELAEQRKLFRLLRPRDIGIRLKRNMMMEPEYSTTAAVFPI